MLILGFDTSTPIGNVALAKDNELIIEENLEIERTHIEKLLPAIDSVLKRAKYDITQVEGIVVGLGPGSFTGTRIGGTVAKGLAQSLDVKLVGVSSLDGIAFDSARENKLTCPVVDARRKEVYSAVYCFESNKLKRISDYQVIAPSDLADDLLSSFASLKDRFNEDIILTGNGLYVYKDIFIQKLGSKVIFSEENKWFPKAFSLIKIASDRFVSGKTDDIFQLVPIYVRLSDAREKRET
ncbi:MAG: tRNA (adenosine(37)-N6)-threonylcarbamoyltransferase complex dimerization subunit type 1 TsaB [Actinobacteria bacterium]|nr:tRNA (adenosine(37)-N6)-threonylcarbamoyltransferase complex dimerization subunit type 1 TsaB [Actinomycetota bacterium]